MIHWFLVSALAAPPMVLDIPFPASPVFEGEQRVCVTVTPPLGVPHVETSMGGFGASCRSDADHTEACLTVEAGTRWPRRFPKLVCDGPERDLVVRPVPAFDPLDDPIDGVRIVRDVAQRRAAFRVPEMADAAGILDTGRCGVSDGLLWVEVAEEPRQQLCTLILPDSTEFEIPITLVARLQVRRSDDGRMTPPR